MVSMMFSVKERHSETANVETNPGFKEITRYLIISDRNKEDNSDAERLIPLGLMIR